MDADDTVFLAVSGRVAEEPYKLKIKKLQPATKEIGASEDIEVEANTMKCLSYDATEGSGYYLLEAVEKTTGNGITHYYRTDSNRWWNSYSYSHSVYLNENGKLYVKLYNDSDENKTYTVTVTKEK